MKILIVDDEPHVLRDLPKTFERFYPKAEVHTAHSFEKAQELLRENKYEIILLDGYLSEEIVEPWEHGYGRFLIPVIRNSSSVHAKIIMVSRNESENQRGISLGADLALSKNLFWVSPGVLNYLDVDFSIKPHFS